MDGLFPLLRAQETLRDVVKILQIKDALLGDQRPSRLDDNYRHLRLHPHVRPHLRRQVSSSKWESILNLVNSLSKFITLKLSFVCVNPLFVLWTLVLHQICGCVRLHKIAATSHRGRLLKFHARVENLNSRWRCVVYSFAANSLGPLREISMVLSNTCNSTKGWSNALRPHRFISARRKYVRSTFLWWSHLFQSVFEPIESNNNNCHIIKTSSMKSVFHYTFSSWT